MTAKSKSAYATHARNRHPKVPLLKQMLQRESWGVALLLSILVSTCLKIWFLLNRPADTFRYFASDELFYQTQIAHHWMTMGWPSFDGIHVTTGIQPLFSLFLMPLAPFFENDPGFAMAVNLGLSTGFSVGIAITLPGLMRDISGEYWGSRAGVLAGCLWLFHPRLIDLGFQGTGLALVGFVYILIFRAWLNSSGSPFDSFKIGLLIGVGFLAKMEFLVLAVWLPFWSAKQYQTHPLSRCAATFSGILLLVLPWVFYCWVLTGSFVPDSLKANHLKFTALEHVWDAKEGSELNDLGTQIRDSYPPKHWQSIGLTLVSGRTGLSALSILGWIIFAFWLLIIAENRPKYLPRFNYLKRLRNDAQWLPCLVGYLFVYSRGSLADFTSLYLLLSIIVGFAWVIMLVPHLPGSKVIDLSFAFIGWMALSNLGLINDVESNIQLDEVKSAVARFETQVPVDAQIGAFDAGMIGVLIEEPRRVVNLSGQVNHEALKALKDKTLLAYLHRAGIRYLIDYQDTLLLYEIVGAPRLSESLQVLDTETMSKDSDKVLRLWEILPGE